MTGIRDFSQRYRLSDIIAGSLDRLFDARDAEIIPFGFELIADRSACLREYISTPRSNMSHSSMLVKFAPDFILFKKGEPQEIYFLEIKVSKTPLRFYSRLRELQAAHPNDGLRLSDIGDIAREAWNAYVNLYPNTIIIDGCSYNPKVLMAQFADRVQCLRCFNPRGAVACNDCPVRRREFFEYEVNENAAGSKTPHTNLNYASFDRLENFFAGLNIRLNGECVRELTQRIKNLGVFFPDGTDERIKSQVLHDLRNDGCDWL